MGNGRLKEYWHLSEAFVFSLNCLLMRVVPL